MKLNTQVGYDIIFTNTKNELTHWEKLLVSVSKLNQILLMVYKVLVKVM